MEEFRTFDSILEAPKQVALDPGISNTLSDAFTGCFQRVAGNRIAISISGGVDSMVAAHVAKQVCDRLGKELILLHICYGNRDCCEDEVNLLRWYSQTLGVSLYVRWITEMKRCRTSGLRAVYEEVTRRIRFSFYAWFECPVVLGHNLDDCYENIFRNLSQQIHFDNLFGMSPVGQEQGVVILRPMLSIPKKEIVAFADFHNIPHLYDSTPAWSQRGQMRDKLIPGIQSFDPHILKGLASFVSHTSFLETQWNLAFEQWKANVRCESDGLTIPRDAFFASNKSHVSFWVRVWKEWSLSDRPSNKSVRNFMEFLDRGSAKKCNLNNAWVAILSNTQIQLVRM